MSEYAKTVYDDMQTPDSQLFLAQPDEITKKLLPEDMQIFGWITKNKRPRGWPTNQRTARQLVKFAESKKRKSSKQITNGDDDDDEESVVTSKQAGKTIIQKNKSSALKDWRLRTPAVRHLKRVLRQRQIRAARVLTQWKEPRPVEPRHQYQIHRNHRRKFNSKKKFRQVS